MQPELEAEFTQLNRDYEIHKRQYESLVSRRESAAMSGDMDATGSVAEFRVVDPPTLPQKPAAPNRLLMLPLALAAALGAGVLASFAFSQFRPVVHDARTLRAVSGRPVLGAVTYIMTGARTRTRRFGQLVFAGAVSGLFAVYGVAIVLLAVAGRSL